jgi:UDP-glucuronate decarboxylase
MMRNPVIQEDVEMIVRADLPWSAFQGCTVLVSGASGFVPAYMVETLLHLNDARNYGITVVGLVRNQGRAHTRFAYALGRKDLKFIVQDVSTPLSYPGTIDYVIHAASQASPKHFGRDPVGTLLANTQGTLNMLALAAEKKVKGFLFFSSGEVYGQVDPAKLPIKETDYGYIDPTDVRSCYAESKRVGETMCVAWHQQYLVPAKIVRLFHTYGPGMRLDDGRVFADFVRDIVEGRDIIMKSEGRAVRPFCYLADATAGFFTVLLKGENAHAYNIGNDKAEISIAELADTLVRLFPERNLKVIRQIQHRGQEYLESPISRNCPDISKVSRLGWEPSTTVEQGFARTIRSYA